MVWIGFDDGHEMEREVEEGRKEWERENVKERIEGRKKWKVWGILVFSHFSGSIKGKNGTSCLKSWVSEAVSQSAGATWAPHT